MKSKSQKRKCRGAMSSRRPDGEDGTRSDGTVGLTGAG